MQSPRYAVGETVLYNERHPSGCTWKVPYIVMAGIRSNSLEPRYLIDSRQRSHGRVAGEHELCRMPQPLHAFGRLPNGTRDDAVGIDAANLNLPPRDDRFTPRWRVGSAAGGFHA